MKLVSIKLPDLPILRSQSHFNCGTPPELLRGFSVRVRGRAVFLVSPPGWLPGQPDAIRPPTGPRRTFGPLEAGADCVLQWEGDDVDACVKYDGEPMGWTAEQIAEELERATAPVKAAAKR